MRMRKVDFVVQHPCHHLWEYIFDSSALCLDSDEVKDTEVTFWPGTWYKRLCKAIRGRSSSALDIRWAVCYWEAKSVVRVISPLDAIISSTVVSLTDSLLWLSVRLATFPFQSNDTQLRSEL